MSEEKIKRKHIKTVKILMILLAISAFMVSMSSEVKAIQHLRDLGFIKGTEIRVISHVNGNLIIDIKGTRLALESSLANRIFV